MIWRIRCIFGLQSLAFGAWLPRIPEVKDALGMSPSVLALVLLGMPLGIMTVLPVAGRAVGWLGPARALFWLFPPYLLALGLLAFAPSPPFLFAAFALAGVLMALVELAQNLLADQIEKSTGRLIMSSCHGFWSLGTMAGSLVGAALAGWHLKPSLSGAVLTAAILPVVLWLILGLRARVAALPVTAPAPPAASRHRWALPAPEVAKIGLFLFGIAMVEGAMMDWSPLFLRDTFGLGAGVAGLGVTLFSAFMTLGRLRGDALRLRLGASLSARICGGAALLALLALVLSPAAATAYLALVVLGLGASLGFPLAISSAAQLPGQRVESSVAVITFIALLGFLTGPVLIGFVSEAHGLRWGLAAVALPLMLSLAMTPSLGSVRGQTRPVP